MLKQDDYIKSKLVELGWRFGRTYSGGHLAGQMVMQAIANRFRVGWGSWLQVVDRVPLFMAESAVPPLEHPSVWEPSFIKLLHVVDGVFDGSIPDLSKGALYFGDLGRIENPWFLEKIVRQPEFHQRVADMNSLSFWK